MIFERILVHSLYTAYIYFRMAVHHKLGALSYLHVVQHSIQGRRFSEVPIKQSIAPRSAWVQ